jgi:hypothetical protein
MKDHPGIREEGWSQRADRRGRIKGNQAGNPGKPAGMMPARSAGRTPIKKAGFAPAAFFGSCLLDHIFRIIA